MRRIEDCLLRRGWDRIHDNLSTDFYLKWVELKSQIHYSSFKEGTDTANSQARVCTHPIHPHTPSPRPRPTHYDSGRQLVNHFPNIGLLTTKTGLLESLRELSRSKTLATRCSRGAAGCVGCSREPLAVWGAVGSRWLCGVQ